MEIPGVNYTSPTADSQHQQILLTGFASLSFFSSDQHDYTNVQESFYIIQHGWIFKNLSMLFLAPHMLHSAFTLYTVFKTFTYINI